MKVVAYMSKQSFEKKVSSSSNMLHNTWKKDHNSLPSPFSAIAPPSSFRALGLMFSLCTPHHIVILWSDSTIIFVFIFTLSFCMLTSLFSFYIFSTISCTHSILHLHYACLFRHLHSTLNLPSSFYVFFLLSYYLLLLLWEQWEFVNMMDIVDEPIVGFLILLILFLQSLHFQTIL